MPYRIPLSLPNLGEMERSFVLEALESTNISSFGDFLDRFQSEFAAVCEANFSLCVSNGTVALHLALLAMDAGPGDEVIVPSLTYIASVNAVTYVGATPVFCDVDPSSWCLDSHMVEAAVTSRTVGILAVDLYGMPANYQRLREIASRHGLWIIEDAAESIFAKYRGKPTGCLGDIATFSFYGNKLITCGEGGAITTNDSQLFKKMALLRGQGMDSTRRYYFPVVGYNYRLSNLAAALLYAQFSRRGDLIERRNRVVHTYREGLKKSQKVVLRRANPEAVESPWLETMLVSDGLQATRDRLCQQLDDAGIETRPIFIPIHTLPPYQGSQRFRLDVTEVLGRSGFSVPTHPNLSESEIHEVIQRIEES